MVAAFRGPVWRHRGSIEVVEVQNDAMRLIDTGWGLEDAMGNKDGTLGAGEVRQE